MIRLPNATTKLRRALRQREVEAVFKAIPDGFLGQILEIGSGDGAQSPMLARRARAVVSTDLNDERLEREPHPKITYQVCDCEDLPFENRRFDLVYSSNVFEHLLHPAVALAEIHRVLQDEGVFINIIPNKVWKLSHLALFYPNQALTAVELMLSRRRRGVVGSHEGLGNNLTRERSSFTRRHIWPAVHGENPNHLTEFVRMGASFWRKSFDKAGFHLAGRISGLPFHTPYRFGYERPRRVLEALGLSSTNGYVLVKKGHGQEMSQLFTDQSSASAS
jgi:SAM-dependent methyltransferase